MVWDREPEDIPHFRQMALGIGTAKRISIPLTDQQRLYQELADMLRGLAQEVDLAARGIAGCPAPGKAETVTKVRIAVDNFNSRKQELLDRYGIRIREGRPKDSERAREREGNKGETVSGAVLNIGPHLVCSEK